MALSTPLRLAFVLLSATGFAGLPSDSRGEVFLIPEQGSIALVVQNLAQSGDTLSIADGTHSGVGFTNFEFDAMSLTVKSRSGDPNLCVFDLSGTAGFSIKSLPEGPFAIHGIGFRNASGPAIAQVNARNITVRNCRFEGSSSPTVRLFASNVDACEFVSNTGTAAALSMGQKGGLVSGSVFRNNEGRGAEIDGGPGTSAITEVLDCVFDGNARGGLLTTGDAVRVSNCQFLGNGGSRIDWGAGLRGEHEGAVQGIEVADCEFDRNVARASAGLSVSGPAVITDSRFSGNTGGGLSLGVGSGSGQVLRCTFVGNRADLAGGGVSVGGGPQGSVSVEACQFLENQASRGGGIRISNISGSIERCLFSRNAATLGGSAIELAATYARPATVRIRSTTLVQNRGSAAIYGSEDLDLDVETTIVAFTGLGSAVEFASSFSGTSNFKCTNIFGNDEGDWDNLVGWEGQLGNISADPEFCDCQGQDYGLASQSPSLAANQAACDEDMGSESEGCATSVGDCALVPVRVTSWGSIKATFAK